MKDIYTYWDSSSVVEKYSVPRSWKRRFKSEVFFLEKVAKPGMSVLDVGCAAGDLYHGLVERIKTVKYTGIDIAENLVTLAKDQAPGVEFIHGNLLDSDFLNGRQYELVTATGVFQHEPNFDDLFSAMFKHTLDKGYLLFDVKLFHNHDTLCDLDISYCDHKIPIYFIVYRLKEFLDKLSIYGISSINFFGYYSGTHESVKLPQSVDEEVCSAHVLIQKDSSALDKPNVDLHLPKGFIN